MDNWDDFSQDDSFFSEPEIDLTYEDPPFYVPDIITF